MLLISVIGVFILPILNFIAIHWDKRLKPVYPPVYGMGLERRLKWYQPIPSIFGIGMLLGHQCNGGTVIWRYVVGEYITLLLFGLAVWQIGWKPELAVAVWLTAILVIIVQTDLTDMIIPNKVVAVGSIGAILLRLYSHPLPWYEYALGTIIVSLLLLLIAVIGSKLLCKEAMGGGDIKLYLFIGVVLGWKLALLSLFLASIVGFVGGLAAIAAQKNRSSSRTIPFGPYIAVGTLISYYWGNELLHWYLSLITIAG